MKKLFTALVVSTVLTSPVWAAPQTVVLSLPGMDCAACPITVKTALKKVEGVNEVDVSYKAKAATVTFDDAVTDVEALTAATANAGYPSTAQPLEAE